MSLTFIVIIGVLIFIAYQLSQLNRTKRNELVREAAEKFSEKSEQKYRDLFPNLYPVASEDMKQEIRDFMALKAQNDVLGINLLRDEEKAQDQVNYIYMERYKIINDKIETETNLQNKQRMNDVKESTSKELKQLENHLDVMVNKGKISEWEKSLVLWNLLKGINEQFPERHFKFNDYINSKFGSLQLTL